MCASEDDDRGSPPSFLVLPDGTTRSRLGVRRHVNGLLVSDPAQLTYAAFLAVGEYTTKTNSEKK